MKKSLFMFIILLFCFTTSGTGKKDFSVAVREAVNYQLQKYPKSTLKDLYKNFFQDKFGPGHLMRDTVAAGNYLRQELASYTETEGAIAEPTGWEGNFLRVNLSVIKNNQVPYDIYFDAFVRSVQGIQPISIAEWQEEWSWVESIIRSMNLSLPDYEADRKEIEDRLNDGNFVGHHSQTFEDNYSPHYRIISREIYEKELMPLISR